MFEAFIQNLNATTGGAASYEASKDGAAIHTAIPNSVRRQRAFRIINHSAFGSRTTPAPRRRANIRYQHGFDIPTPQGGTIHVTMPYGYPYASLRPLPATPNLRSIAIVGGGHPALQISSNTLWLNFDIETATNSAEVMKQIYHAFVRPEGVPYGAGPMAIFENPTLGLAPTATPEAIAARAAAPEVPRAALPRAEAPDAGKGKDWDLLRRVPEVPAESALEAVSVEIQKQRKETIQASVREAEEKKRQAAAMYQTSLRAFNEAFQKMKLAESLAEERKRTAQQLEENQEDDGFLVIRNVLANYYEKIWIAQPPEDAYGPKRIYALTKPVVIKHGDDIKDKFAVLAGKFIVSMGLNGEEPRYVREDKRFAKHNGNEIHAPHGKNANDVCWGVYRETMHTLYVQRDYAQILLLVYKHLTNSENHYISLREYAKKLRLPYTEDPTVDLMKAELEKEAAAVAARAEAARLEAERQAAARAAVVAETERLKAIPPAVQPVVIPGRPAVAQPAATPTGIEVAEVTAEELAQFFRVNRVAVPEQLVNAGLVENLNLENV
jgi:hypothetical protein